ncbi:hypothetical protein [Sphingomonas sp. TZW2008]|uniref:hypothetical protein n=1 Tax=Sphingomonas sp. TZW2008 TaxID=1917973 RepID=UPI000A26AE8D|nr:hypothetical protein [Sphingomonas sp. TZW2008]
MFRPLIAVRASVLAPLLAAAFVLPAAASAQAQDAPMQDFSQAETGQPPQRIRQVTLQGAEQCPKAAADEIVVCSRINPNEQYRVPKELRTPPEIPAQNQSWVNRAAAVDQVGRVAGGLPNTCSPVGTGGQTGCAIVAARNYAAEKRQAKREAEQAAPLTDPNDDGGR